jgi:hypothetical protein
VVWPFSNDSFSFLAMTGAVKRLRAVFAEVRDLSTPLVYSVEIVRRRGVACLWRAIVRQGKF